MEWDGFFAIIAIATGLAAVALIFPLVDAKTPKARVGYAGGLALAVLACAASTGLIAG